MRRSERWLVASLTTLVVSWGFACGPRHDFSTGGRTFDAKLWAEGHERWRMCDDLRKHYLHVGMEREQVLRLLGPATEDDARGLGYDVGGHWLGVVFDDQQRLRETQLGTY